jgi:D-methionine transport system substrate-binding protein
VKHVRLSVLCNVLAVLLLPACKKSAGGSADAGVVRIGASAVPHAPILKVAAAELAKENITLKIITFNDYVQPNLRLADGDLDANYYQTQPYLDFFNAQHHLHLVNLGRVHVEPFGLYSRRHKALAALPDGAWIAIPNEISNGHRALELLAHAGLIKLDAARGLAAGVKDIVDNSHHLRFKEVEAAMMPRILDDVDVAGINTNFALAAGMQPGRDALALETGDSPYANIMVAQDKDAESPVLRRVLAVLHGEAVTHFIAETYKGSVLSAP